MLGHIMAEIISHTMMHYKDEPAFSLRLVQKDIINELDRLINLLVLDKQRSGKPLAITALRPYARQYIRSYNKRRADNE